MTGRKKYSKGYKMVRMPRQVLPARMMVKLPYWDIVQIVNTPHTDGTADYVYCLNSLFDPDVTGGGHQPRGFDQWSALFGQYMVHGCKYEVRFYTSDIGAVSDIAIFMDVGTIVGPNNVSSLFTANNDLTFNEYPADGYHKTRRIVRNSSSVAVSQATAGWDSRSSLCKGYVKMKRLHDDFRGILYGTNTTHYIWPQDYQSSVAGNPNSEQYLVLFANSLLGDGSGGTLNALPYVYADVKLTYYVEFFAPVYPAAS